MQGKCAVIQLICVDESERQFGFVHIIPKSLICIEAVQANDVINATTGASEWRRTWRYILQAAVTIPLIQHHRNNKGTLKRPKLPKNMAFLGSVKTPISAS